MNSAIWSLSTAGYGVTLEGIEVLKQCISLILNTTKGSDPLRPEFGTTIFKYIDYPASIAAPNIKREILEALELWETRIRVKKINHDFDAKGNLRFALSFEVNGLKTQDSYTYTPYKTNYRSESNVEYIIQAVFPPNEMKKPYLLSFFINNTKVKPLPHIRGYENKSMLFAWIQENWAYFGRWVLLEDRIIGYIQSSDLKQANLEITILQQFRYQANFPEKLTTQKWGLILKTETDTSYPKMPEFGTTGEVVFWLIQNLSTLGTFEIHSIEGNLRQEFSEEFSSEFATGGITYYVTLLSKESIKEFQFFIVQ